MAFANSIARSKWYKDAFMDREVLSATTRRMRKGDSVPSQTGDVIKDEGVSKPKEKRKKFFGMIPLSLFGKDQEPTPEAVSVTPVSVTPAYAEQSQTPPVGGLNPPVGGTPSQRGRALKMKAVHLDASSNVLRRNSELRALANADKENECRILCNVRLFTEGVDVPSLDAVVFLDPRASEIDVVQAVGRVMRKSPGKEFGHIVVPVVIEPGKDVESALLKGTEGYKTVGKVLRALRAHDSRLIEQPATFIDAYEATDGDGIPGDGEPRDPEQEYLQNQLELKRAEEGIYAHIVSASGIGKPGELTADIISDSVRRAASFFITEDMGEALGKALDIDATDTGGVKEACTVASLLIFNACLIQRRLSGEPKMKHIEKIGALNSSNKTPKGFLVDCWKEILKKDYRPVFEPALAAIEVLPEREVLANALRALAECADNVADSLSEMGYDYAGPLYHRILGSAKSDGAFYTNNISAVMLAQLAFGKDASRRDFVDWSDPEAVGNLRIMDPACGTGTLLMATLQTIKNHVAACQGQVLAEDPHTPAPAAQSQTPSQRGLHKRLVEDVLCGLDINRHGVQLAACNMTLGAPSVDYRRMNLVTMPHGIQSDGTPKAGSLEILTAADDALDLSTMRQAPQRNLENLEAEQVNESAEIRFPLRNLDAVIMNAPFTDNKKRGRKFTPEAVKKMQKHELDIRDHLAERDSAAGRVITSNSIQTFFTPLSDWLLSKEKGTLAMVIPTTVCTGKAALAQRCFLAERFHIETVVTSHDPHRPNFVENSGIHESLLICRRPKNRGGRDLPTRFVSLRKMPANAKEATEAVQAISSGNLGRWGTVHHWPAERVQEGDWTPCQWYDGKLAQDARNLELPAPLKSKYKIGPSGRAIRGTFRPVDGDDNSYRVFWGISKNLRTTMQSVPEQAVEDKNPVLANRYRQQAGHLLLAARFNTNSGRLLAIFSEQEALGSIWIPVQTEDKKQAKALCAWFNSTLGALGFMIRRSATLMFPSFSQADLATLPVPDFSKTSPDMLAQAFEQTKDMKVQPWKNAADDDLRDCLDRAASETTGIDIATIRDLRVRISREPTVSNAYAPEGS